MTAIGLLDCAGWPLLVGDVAISSVVQRQSAALLPSIGAVHSETRDNLHFRSIGGQIQKLVTCHPHLAVGWSGSPFAAASLVGELRKLLKPTAESVANCIRQQEPSRLTDELEILGIVGEQERWTCFRATGTKYEELDGGWMFAGSGAELLADVAERTAAEMACSSSPDGAARLGFMAGALLMGDEFANQVPLRHCFGGGYEVVTWQGDGFKKVSGPVYYFTEVRIAGGTVEVTPLRVVRPSYFEGFLCIEGASLSKGGPKTSHEVFVINHPDIRISVSQLERLKKEDRGFESSHVALTVIVRAPEQDITSVLCLYGHDGVHVDQKGGIEVDARAHAEVNRVINEVFAGEHDRTELYGRLVPPPPW